MDHLLARATPHMLRLRVQQVQPLHGQLPGGLQGSRRLGFQDELHLLREFIDGADLERHCHPPARTHGIDRPAEN